MVYSALQLRNLFQQQQQIIGKSLELSGFEKILSAEVKSLTQPLWDDVKNYINKKPHSRRCFTYGTSDFYHEKTPHEIVFHVPLASLKPIPLITEAVEVNLFNQENQQFEWITIPRENINILEYTYLEPYSDEDETRGNNRILKFYGIRNRNILIVPGKLM